MYIHALYMAIYNSVIIHSIIFDNYSPVANIIRTIYIFIPPTPDNGIYAIHPYPIPTRLSDYCCINDCHCSGV